MSQATTVKEVLIAAKWILENKGWCKGAFYRNKKGEELVLREPTDLRKVDSCCLYGAMRLVETDMETGNNEMVKSVVNVLHELYSTANIATFNDFVASDKKDVIRVLDEAIKRRP